MMILLRKKAKGYSLMELMAALAIMVILATIGVSTYTRYLAKQLVVNAINATSYLRQAIEDYYALYGYLPSWNDLIGGPGAPYITGYDVANSQVHYSNPERDISYIQYNFPGGGNCTSSLTNCTDTGDTLARELIVIFSNPTSTASSLLANKGFLMRINLNSGVITWECAQYSGVGYGAVSGSLLPSSCYKASINE